LIEAVMLVMLGFLCATLLALAAVPALARRADRLARKRAEAAFPLSLAEIAADRDHLRAELALRARTLEQQAERGFAAKAGAMQEVGRRDMDIAQLKRDLAARDGRIADLEGDLSTTRTELDGTRASLAAEMAAHADTAQTLEKRVADLAALEQNLAETRHALTGTGVDLSERTSELENERATLGRVQALLAQRETELANQCTENDRLRVAHVEGRTQIMVLEGKSEDLAQRLDTAETTLAQTSAALKAMTTDRDSERLRANTLEARAVQAEAGLAAAAAASVEAAAEAQAVRLQREQDAEAHRATTLALETAEAALETAQAGLLVARGRRDEEIMTMREDLREREQRIETLHAEIQTLQGALSQARSDRQRLKREVAQAGKAAATKAAPAADNAALRKQIVEIADRLMSLEAKREAAE
jgi:chromosome segregation ATPase